MNQFLLSTASQQEIQSLDNKIHETVETINSLKTSREFFLSFAKDPQLFINKWLQSQSRDLKTMTDVTGNPEEERRVDYYYQPWVTEAVCRSVFSFISTMLIANKLILITNKNQNENCTKFKWRHDSVLYVNQKIANDIIKVFAFVYVDIQIGSSDHLILILSDFNMLDICCRYFYGKIQQKRAELDASLGVRNG